VFLIVPGYSMSRQAGRGSPASNIEKPLLTNQGCSAMLFDGYFRARGNLCYFFIEREIL